MGGSFSALKIFIIIVVMNAIFSTFSNAAITIDGRLDEVEWKQAQRFASFVETRPFSLKESTIPTEVLVLTDKKGNLYWVYQPTIMGYSIQKEARA
ncbi:MAG: hypothetical protein Ct9H300mP4_00110 [Gammaproteobacteria bacterium]|nr:MAG: hypothetical protein Ct9H300mP4_00110 [Gammaproteobacteria bacterium]